VHNYKYKTVDASGRTQSGVLAAKSEVEVASYLREKDLFAISIEKMAKQNLLTKDVSIGSKRVKIVHLVIFCRQLSAMLKAGMPLDKSLTTQIRQTESKVMKKALITLSGQIQQGVLMSRAMYDQPNIFPKILINSVEAGEKTGHLDDALVKMGDYFYKQDIIKKKIKGAMWYPMAILIFTIGIATALIVLAVPAFAGVIIDSGGTVPGITQFYLDLSDSIRAYWYIYLLVIAALIFGVRRWLSTNKGRTSFDRVKLRLPKVKKLVKQIIAARFSRTFASMVTSGLSIIESIEIAGESLNNNYAENKVIAIIDEVKKGEPASKHLEATGIFPIMMVSMLSVGEEVGEIEDMMIKVADYYDEEATSAIDKLIALINPLMIVFVAGIVGSIVLALYMPLLDSILTAF